MMANETETLKAIQREQENLEWINKSLSQLRRSFGDRYIAVRDRKVIDSDKSFDKLLARVRKLPNPETVTVEFVTALEYLWLL